MKKFMSALCAAVLVFTGGAVYSAGENEVIGSKSDIKIIIDGHEYSGEDKPVIINDRTYLPLRAMSEAMGASVAYNADSNTAAITSKADVPYPGDDWIYSTYTGDDEKEYICFRDKDGEIKLKTEYERHNSDTSFKTLNLEDNVFHEGMAVIKKRNGGKDETGYLDIYGNEIMVGKYSQVEPFYEGLAGASTSPYNDIWGKPMGFINKAGEMVIPEKYRAIRHFSEGLCAVSEDGYLMTHWYFIDKNGDKAFGDKQYILANSFSDGYCVVQTRGIPQGPPVNVEKFSYIDHTGNLATDKEWDRASDFVDGYAIVEDDGVRMKIDKNFKVIEVIEDKNAQ